MAMELPVKVEIMAILKTYAVTTILTVGGILLLLLLL